MERNGTHTFCYRTRIFNFSALTVSERMQKQKFLIGVFYDAKLDTFRIRYRATVLSRLTSLPSFNNGASSL